MPVRSFFQSQASLGPPAEATYVPFPYEQILAQGLMKQQEYNKVQDDINKLGVLVASMEPRTQDIDFAKQVQSEYNTRIDDIMKRYPDLTQARGAYNKLLRDVGSDQRIKDITHNKTTQDKINALMLEGKLEDRGLPAEFKANYVNRLDEFKRLDPSGVLLKQDFDQDLQEKMKLIQPQITEELINRYTNNGQKTYEVRKIGGVDYLVIDGIMQTKSLNSQVSEEAVNSLKSNYKTQATPHSRYAYNVLGTEEGVNSYIDNLFNMHKVQEEKTVAQEEFKQISHGTASAKSNSEKINSNTESYGIMSLGTAFEPTGTTVTGYQSTHFVDPETNKPFETYTSWNDSFKSLEMTLGNKKEFAKQIFEGMPQDFVSEDDITTALDIDGTPYPIVKINANTIAANIYKKNLDKYQEMSEEQAYDQIKKEHNLVPLASQYQAMANARMRELSEKRVVAKEIDDYVESQLPQRLNSLQQGRLYPEMYPEEARELNRKIIREFVEGSIGAFSPYANTFLSTNDAKLLNDLYTDAFNKGGSKIWDHFDYSSAEKILDSYTDPVVTDATFGPVVSHRAGRRASDDEMARRPGKKETHKNLRQYIVSNEFGDLINMESVFAEEDRLRSEKFDELKKLDTQKAVNIIRFGTGVDKIDNTNPLAIYQGNIEKSYTSPGKGDVTSDGKPSPFYSDSPGHIRDFENVVIINDNPYDTSEVGKKYKQNDRVNAGEMYGLSRPDNLKNSGSIVGLKPGSVGFSYIDGKWRSVGDVMYADGSTGDTVAFDIPGMNTNRDIFGMLGISDPYETVNLVDRVLDGSDKIDNGTIGGARRARGKGLLIPGIESTVVRGRAGDGLQYSVFHNFTDEQINTLNNNLLQTINTRYPEYSTEDKQAMFESRRFTKAELNESKFTDKYSMGLQLQMLINTVGETFTGSSITPPNLANIPSELKNKYNTRAARNNNPFNIKDTGVGEIGVDDEEHAIFKTLQEGYDAGLQKINNIYSGLSSDKYSIEMTLEEFAKTYATNPAHADSLSEHLGGIPKTTKLKNINKNDLIHAILKQEDINLYKYLFNQ